MRTYTNDQLFSIFISAIFYRLKENFPVPFFIENLLEIYGFNQILSEWNTLKEKGEASQLLTDEELYNNGDFDKLKSSSKILDKNFSNVQVVFVYTIKFLESEGYIKAIEQGNYTLTEKGLRVVNSNSNDNLPWLVHVGR